jgi:hypothetical protein
MMIAMNNEEFDGVSDNIFEDDSGPGGSGRRSVLSDEILMLFLVSYKMY